MVTETVIPKGCKQSEAGVIPRDWTSLQIPEMTVRTVNSIKIGPFGSALKKEYLTKEGYKVYGQENVYERDMSLGDRFLSEEHFRELKSCEIVPGDFLISMMGTVGKCMIVPDDIDTGIMDSHLLRIKFDTTKVQTEYISQLFETRIIFDQIKQLSVGGIMEGLSSKIIRSLFIPLPPTKTEQAAIATALSDTDELISKLDELIVKKRNIKQGTMQELLTGKKRLPGFSGKWEVKKMGDLLDYEQPTKYLVTDTEYNDNNVTPVLTAGKTFILGYTNEENGIFSNNLPVIIFDDFTTAKKYVTFPFKAKSSAMKILKPKSDTVNLRFVFEKMQLIIFLLGDHKRYWISEYQNIEIEVPAPEEQSAISQVLSDMDLEIEELEKKLDKYKMIKQGMMQELLTGRTRLI